MFVALVHVVPRQTYGAPLQSAVVEQLVRHAPALQPYGAHCCVVGVTHIPLELQVEFGVRVDPEQLAGMQTVPAA
jgi:hypothetical protein